MDPREYITSERFIWDALIDKGLEAVREAREMWRRDKHIPRILFSFPAEHVRTVDGKEVTDVVAFPVPDGMPTFKAAVELAKATKAYGLLLLEQRERDICITLESMHGSKQWTMQIKDRGDRQTLEKEEATTDTESIGVLWRPHTARS